MLPNKGEVGECKREARPEEELFCSSSRISPGMVQAGVVQNVTFLARLR